jgi:SAM-dependent methyltransferase
MSHEVLQRQLESWNRKPGLRALYAEWFGMVAGRLAGAGPTLEVGGGIGKLREHVPGLLILDLQATPWTDVAGDAQRLPFRSESLGNIVAFDVLHHLPRPAAFFREAERVLAPGGRLIVVDPYASWLSTPVYRYLHPERLDLSCDPFDENRALCDDEAFDSNQAVATVMFHKRMERFAECFPDLRLLERRRMALLAYPLSGGFSGRTLMPQRMLGPLSVLERGFSFLAPLMAFRTMVVLEK